MSNDQKAALPAFCSALIQSDGKSRQLGQYQVGETIYADRSRVVFQSEDPLTERAILIAVFAGKAEAAEEARARLLPGHDFFYPVHELVAVGGAAAMVLPVLNGLRLSDLLAKSPRLPLAQALRIAREVLLALAVGQERGLLHGSIDADWVWVEPDNGHCRLIGLGWRMLEPAGTGELADFLASGSARVPAPEVTEGKSPGAGADLFGAGMLLYRMLTGKPAYEGNSPLEIIRALAMGEPECPGSSVSGIPAQVDLFVIKLLARSVENRSASARDAAREIK
ncbi:MAG: serine/threonine protein kinase, partial [bacterium]